MDDARETLVLIEILYITSRKTSLTELLLITKMKAGIEKLFKN